MSAAARRVSAARGSLKAGDPLTAWRLLPEADREDLLRDMMDGLTDTGSNVEVEARMITEVAIAVLRAVGSGP